MRVPSCVRVRIGVLASLTACCLCVYMCECARGAVCFHSPAVCVVLARVLAYVCDGYVCMQVLGNVLATHRATKPLSL